jgi:signal transduction histidine kinase
MRLAFINPRTITGQITGLVVLSVMIALGLSFAAVLFFLSSARGRLVDGPPPMSFVMIGQLAAAAKSDSEISTIVTNAQRIGLAVTLIPRAQAPGAGRNPAQVSGLAQAAFARLKSAPGMDAVNSDLYLAPDETVRLALRNGSALTFPLPDGPGDVIPDFIMGPLLNTLAIIAVCVLGISLYAARFIAAPLSSFAAAADAVGRAAAEGQSVSERWPHEIAQVARALNDMRARIKGLLDERTYTLTAISHDLRTPLTRMKLRAERVSKLLSDDVLADGMFADIARMEQMLSETLAYLRDDSLTEAPVFVDLPSILQTICTDLSDLGEPVTYDGPERLTYICKPSAITRAITNLVDNAMKYGTQVSVALRWLANKSVQIDVMDNGPGIPHSHRKRVFEPFFRADAARTFNTSEGFGLGLSIVRNVVEDHRGTIDLLACDPHGLDVRIVLPGIAALDSAK